MTTFPLPTMGPTIDASGITAPSYADIFANLQYLYQSIYGTDVVLDPSTQDGQWLGIQAASINDSNNAAIAVYEAQSPSTAQGNGLSSIVKINGLKRDVPTNSTADITIVGTFGTVIANGVVGDNLNLGTKWALPASVTIPMSGTIVQTATCTTPGAVVAASASLTKILTPTRGWLTANNVAAATVGEPVETDAGLRQRQSVSASLPASDTLSGTVAAIVDVPGVTMQMVYENDTNSTDANTIPAHSISAVVLGGDSQAIANAIGLKKPPGTGTYGTTTETYVDSRGIPKPINFYRPTLVPITVEIDVTALTGWLTSTEDLIKAAVAAYINTGGDPSQSPNVIGEDVLFTKLYTPANLGGTPQGPTFDITAIRIARSGSPSAANVVIAFNELATSVVGNITVTPS